MSRSACKHCGAALSVPHDRENGAHDDCVRHLILEEARPKCDLCTHAIVDHSRKHTGGDGCFGAKRGEPKCPCPRRLA